MKQKIFLTSVIAMGFVAPAMAEPSNTDTFPQDGLMLEDYTYTNAATSTNMAGVYEGTVNAVAQYTDNLYQLVAGQYLPGNSETPIDCDQNGYFCPGDNNGVYYSSSAQGLTQCPSGYGNSGTGASSDTECYRQCSGNVTIEHATAVTGNDYYGSGTDTCEPTACENGWHVKEGLDLMMVIGSSEAVDKGHVDLDGRHSFNTSKYNLSITNDLGKFVIDYGNKGIIRGTAQCSTQSGRYPRGKVNGIYTDITTSLTLPDSTGGNCYCRLDSYTASGSNTSVTLSGPWMYIDDFGDDGPCQNNCAIVCSGPQNFYDSDSGVVFYATMFGFIEKELASCEANTITINWTGTSETEINANNAGTATYGSDIRTPRSATPVPGKTFTGWRFSAPTPVSVEPEEPEDDFDLGGLF